MPRGQVAVRSRAGMPNIMTILLGWCLPPDSGPCWGAEETRILFLWSLQASWHQLTFFGKWIKTRLSTSSSFQPSGGSGFVKQLHKVWKVAQNPSHPYPPPHTHRQTQRGDILPHLHSPWVSKNCPLCLRLCFPRVPFGESRGVQQLSFEGRGPHDF